MKFLDFKKIIVLIVLFLISPVWAFAVSRCWIAVWNVCTEDQDWTENASTCLMKDTEKLAQSYKIKIWIEDSSVTATDLKINWESKYSASSLGVGSSSRTKLLSWISGLDTNKRVDFVLNLSDWWSCNFTVYPKGSDTVGTWAIYSPEFKMNLDNLTVSKKLSWTGDTKEILNDLFSLVIKWFYIILAFLAWILFVVGWIRMIFSFGNQESFNKWKNIFVYTAMAIVISVLAYPIITLIQWVLQWVTK